MKDQEKVKGAQEGWKKKAKLVTHASTISPSPQLYIKVEETIIVGPFDHGTWL